MNYINNTQGQNQIQFIVTAAALPHAIHLGNQNRGKNKWITLDSADR